MATMESFAFRLRLAETGRRRHWREIRAVATRPKRSSCSSSRALAQGCRDWSWAGICRLPSSHLADRCPGRLSSCRQILPERRRVHRQRPPRRPAPCGRPRSVCDSPPVTILSHRIVCAKRTDPPSNAKASGQPKQYNRRRDAVVRHSQQGGAEVTCPPPKRIASR